MDKLKNRLERIEKKLGSEEPQPPYAADPLDWHLRHIESLIEGGGSGGKLPEPVEGDEGKVPVVSNDLSTFEYAEKADLVDGKVPAEELPSYVDDVLEFEDATHFPSEGEQGKIYVALDTGYTYRWSGSQYIQIGGQDLSNYLLKSDIVVNPTLEGTEAALTGLEVEGVKYKAPDAELCESILWADLKAKRDAGQLVPGKWYRITDYTLKTSHMKTTSEEHQFDVLVIATDTNKLSEDAKVLKHAGDTYFPSGVKFDAWELKYCLDNDLFRFDWAGVATFVASSDTFYRINKFDQTSGAHPYAWAKYRSNGALYYTNSATPSTGDGVYNGPWDSSHYYYTITSVDLTEGRGVIYHMKDEWDNEAPFDFKNMKFIFTRPNQYFTNGNYFAFSFGALYDFSVRQLSDTSNGRYCWNNKILPNINYVERTVYGSRYSCYSYELPMGFLNSATAPYNYTRHLYNNVFSFATGDSPHGFHDTSSMHDNVLLNQSNDIHVSNMEHCDIKSTFYRLEQGSITPDFYNVKVGTGVVAWYLVGSARYVTIGDACEYITLSYDCRNVTIGNCCKYICFGTSSSPETSASSTKYVDNVTIANNSSYICLVGNGAGSTSNYLKNITIHKGVNGSSAANMLTLTFDRNLAYETEVRAANSTEVII